MKKIKKTYFSIINKIIAIIAAFTGLQACGISITPGYAPPSPRILASFSISGRVETKLNTPIPNIGIELTTLDETEENITFDELTSDQLGNFRIIQEISENHPMWSELPKEITLIAKDIDGEQYGEFKTDTIIVPLEYTKDTTYSNAPYKAEVTDLVITLEEKEQNNNEENDNE